MQRLFFLSAKLLLSVHAESSAVGKRSGVASSVLGHPLPEDMQSKGLPEACYPYCAKLLPGAGI
jgi:hypothetical protein